MPNKIYECPTCDRILEEFVKTDKEKNQDVPYCFCSTSDGKIKMELIGERKEKETQEEALLRILLASRKKLKSQLRSREKTRDIMEK